MLLLRHADYCIMGPYGERYRMTVKQATIQYHAADYIGEPRVLDVIQWLNARPQSKATSDPVEQLIRVNADEWKPGADLNAVRRKIRSILRRSQLHLAPSWYIPILQVVQFSEHRGALVPRPRTDWRRWGIDWDPTAKGMGRAQSLALRSVLDLASEGLLGRVRKCDREGCGEWFYAKKLQQRFHSAECQRFAFTHDKEWMAKHALEMRQRRAAKKAAAAPRVREPKRRGKRR
jgi:predicted RNA-binding Zn ribbon-like protein